MYDDMIWYVGKIWSKKHYMQFLDQDVFLFWSFASVHITLYEGKMGI